MRWSSVAIVLAGFVGCATGDAATTGDDDDAIATDAAVDASRPVPPVVVDAGEAPVCEESCLFPVADHVDLSYVVWGEQDVHYYVPDPAWAMAATHGSRLLAYYVGGDLGDTVSPNWFLATALKETYLGCCTGVAPDSLHPDAAWQHRPAADGDGCFQIEATTAFIELQRIFPAHYAGVTHADVVAGCHVESSAVTMAFYDAFVYGMMYSLLDDPASFFGAVQDPAAIEIAFSLAYNRGVWSQELSTAIGPCAAATDMLDCVFGGTETIAWDHAYAISRYLHDLDAAALAGDCYDAPLSSAQIAAFVDAVAPIVAPGDPAGLRDRAVAAFEADAGGDAGTFQTNFGAVLEVLEAEPFQNPFPQLADWYSVPGPADYAPSWPDVDSTCDSVGPIP